MHGLARILLLSLGLLLSAACALASAQATQPAQGGAVVVWINVDGLRGDYPARADAPFLNGLCAEGAWTAQLQPIFPSLTFPGHLAMATGRGVAGHGVPGNTYYDTQTGQDHNYPYQASLVRAEAIWSAAARQGVRAAVVDWPMSHSQQDLPHPAAYYGERYVGGLSDRERLDTLLAHWRRDQAERGARPPLRLLMGYIANVDVVGHRHAVGHDRTIAAVREADAQLARVHAAAIELFESCASPADELYFIVSSDHGMADVHTMINLPVLLAGVWSDDIRFHRGGSVANLTFTHSDPAARAAAVDAVMAELAKHEYLDAWRADDVPKALDFSDPSRLGEIVISLHPGHAFNARVRDAGITTLQPDERYATHGWTVDAEPGMNGFLAIWRLRRPLTGIDLGPIDQRRLHPMVAQLLGIEPSPGVCVEAVDLPGPVPSR